MSDERDCVDHDAGADKKIEERVVRDRLRVTL
jgi:hypothetical protein